MFSSSQAVQNILQKRNREFQSLKEGHNFLNIYLNNN